MYLGPALFCGVTRPESVDIYRCFGTAWQCHLQSSSSSRTSSSPMLGL